jgi:hypothetical protein
MTKYIPVGHPSREREKFFEKHGFVLHCVAQENKMLARNYKTALRFFFINVSCDPLREPYRTSWQRIGGGPGVHTAFPRAGWKRTWFTTDNVRS